ncbi:major facilitator superfamily domain-containing protein [Fennellomyces sp. T-0311]|nr:major facilitator superfamily domain-containing protein [Fennellomyces sp. T-0311]
MQSMHVGVMNGFSYKEWLIEKSNSSFEEANLDERAQVTGFFSCGSDLRRIQLPSSGYTMANKTDKYTGDLRTSEDVESIAATPAIREPPDGGRGWLVIAGCFLGLFSTQGCWATWGIYLNHYNHYVFPNQMTTLSWIGSLWLASAVVTGPFFSYLTWKIGYRWLLFVGIFCCTLSLMLASLATEIWHLYLTQGFLSGLGASLIWFPCITAPQTWFEKRRGFGVGLAISGSGCGGLALVNVAQAVLEKAGYRWSLRALGFISFALLSFTALVVRPLNPPQKPKQIINFAPFRNMQFNLLFVVQIVTNFSFNIPSTFLPAYASYLRLDDWTAAYLSSIISGVMVMGKIGCGFISDRVGRANMAAMVIILSGTLCLALWLNAHTRASVWAFAALWGFFGGGYMAMIPAVLAQIVGLEEIESANGLVFFGWFFGGLFGSPIASSLIDENGPTGPHYDHAIIFGGVLMVFAGLLALVVRIMRGGINPFRKV